MESQTQNNSSQNSEEKIEIDPEMLVGGVKINYYFHCKTQLWLFSHFVTQEQESDLVLLGKIIGEVAFKEIKSKELIIDQKISIDFVRRKGCLVLYEIKKSSKFGEAHYYQILYYLWYLKKIKGIENTMGVITYPKERKKVDVYLTPEGEQKIEKVLQHITQITSLPQPPKPEYKKYCRKCSYFEFCFC